MARKLSIKEYHAAEGLSKTMMDKLKKSPAHLKAYLDNPTEETEAMLLGAALHTMILEPKKFDIEYAVLPNIDRRTKDGKEEYQAFIEQNAGKEVLTESQFNTVKTWVDAILSKPKVKELLTGKGKNEVSIFWKDEETGETCKARPDRIKDKRIIDLKTAVSAQQDDFQRKAYDLNYHIQAAWFMEAYRHEYHEEPEGFTFIVVEKTDPFNVVIYDADDFFINVGEIESQKLLNIYHECKRTNNWYGYDGEKQEIQTLGLPSYIISKYMEEL